MENATIVTLSPASDSVDVVSFEQAFGEHSEFKGRGRAKRQTRRQARKVKKLTDKSARKRIKQGIKDEAQESRQSRRDKSKSRKVSRKSMGEEPEAEPEVVEQEQYVEPTAQEDQSYEEEPAQEQDYSEEEEQQQDDDWSSSFDGEKIEGAKNIHPEIADLTKRIVWNEAKAKQHDRHRARIHSSALELAKTSHNKRDLMEHRSAIEGHTMEMQKHEERAEELKKHLETKHGDHPHVAHGYKHAHSLLQKGKEKQIDKVEKAKVRETIVQETLRPEFSKQRIDIPAGTQPRTVEIKSNASGAEVVKGMSTGTKWLIAIGLVAGATYLAHKKGLIKF